MSKTSIALLALLVIVAAVALRPGHAADDQVPQVGQQAPGFTLPSQDGTQISLDSFKGKWVVLYFYPKDMTSGCTLEAHNFQRDQAKYDKMNAVILGVSVDTPDSHKQFCTKEGLNFRLLADTKKEVSKSYDSLINLGVAKLSSRHTFLIDPQGIVKKVWLNVDVQKHSREILAALDGFQKTESVKP